MARGTGWNGGEGMNIKYFRELRGAAKLLKVHRGGAVKTVFINGKCNLHILRFYIFKRSCQFFAWRLFEQLQSCDSLKFGQLNLFIQYKNKLILRCAHQRCDKPLVLHTLNLDKTNFYFSSLFIKKPNEIVS